MPDDIDLIDDLPTWLKTRRSRRSFTRRLLRQERDTRGVTTYERLRGGRRGSRKTTTAFSRYRDRFLPGQGRTIVAGVTVLGTFRRRINNVVDMTIVQKATGSISEQGNLQRCWDSLNAGPPYVSGGPLKLIKYQLPSAELKGGGSYVSSQFGGLQPRSDWEYTGRFSCGPQWGSDSLATYLNSGLSSFGSLQAFHTRAWDQLKPRTSEAGFAQFAIELRDLPGSVKTSAGLFRDIWSKLYGYGKYTDLYTPRIAADNFLNHSFGWVPFISDYNSMISAYNRSREIIYRMTMENGRWIRKNRVLERSDSIVPILRLYGSDTEPSDGTFPMNQMCTTRVVDGIPCKGLTDVLVHSSSKVWASGTFKFYRSEFDISLLGYETQIGHIHRMMTVLGVRVNPVILYKVTPWTWLADWFTGFGKFIERLNDFVDDGIVSRNLHVMKSEDRRVIKQASIFFSGSSHLNLRWERSLSLKQREVADSPYGFNVPWPSLSAKQLAILVALGFTRLDSGFISRG